jgi:hypothetical protein
MTDVRGQFTVVSSQRSEIRDQRSGTEGPREQGAEKQVTEERFAVHSRQFSVHSRKWAVIARIRPEELVETVGGIWPKMATFLLKMADFG